MRFCLPLSATLIVLLAACGGPDTAPMLATCDQQVAAAEAALAKGEWTAAGEACRQAQIALGEDLTIEATDGRPLSAHWEQRRDALGGKVAELLPRLAEAPDRAKLAEIDAMIAQVQIAKLSGDWAEARKPAMDRITALEAAAKEAAAREAAAAVAGGYLLIIPDGGKDRSWTEFRTSALAQVRGRLAPVPVVLVDKAPAADQVVGGTITLQTAWERVDYGGPTDVFGKGVPVAMEATLTFTTSRLAGPLDGPHSFAVRKDGPASVNQFGLSGLKNSQQEALLRMMTAKFSGLPAPTDAAKLAADLAAAATRPVPPAWRLASTFRVNSGKAARAAVSYSYDGELATIAAAVRGQLDGAPLVTATDAAAPGGSLGLALVVEEVAYGRNISTSVQSVSGTLPVRMSLDLVMTPAGKEATRRTLVAAIEPSESVNAPDMLDAIRQQRRKLVAELVRQIAAQPTAAQP
jgi:hypothetical protein